MDEAKGDPEKLSQVTADAHRAVSDALCDALQDQTIGVIMVTLQHAGVDKQGEPLTHIALSSNISHRAKAAVFTELAAKSLAIAELEEAEDASVRMISEAVGALPKPH